MLDTASKPDFNASLGYYYQHGDLNTADGSGVRGRLAYNLSNGLTIGANLSYDQAFNTRFSADLKYRFGSNGYGAPSNKKAWETPVIQALSSTVKNRDVRVHDWCSTSSPFSQMACAVGQDVEDNLPGIGGWL